MLRDGGLEKTVLYAGDPKTNPTLAKIVKYAPAGPFAVIKVCGLQFKQGASMALLASTPLTATCPPKPSSTHKIRFS